MTKYNHLSKEDAAVLLVDHQAGLLSLVRDFGPDEFRNNVMALADLAKFFNLPTILTTSFEQGPNGPLMPELKALFPMHHTSPDPAKLTPGTMKTSLQLSKRPARNN